MGLTSCLNGCATARINSCPSMSRPETALFTFGTRALVARAELQQRSVFPLRVVELHAGRFWNWTARERSACVSTENTTSR